MNPVNPLIHKNSLFGSVSYRISDSVVDPGDVWFGFENTKHVLLTHAHFDHIYGLNYLIELNPDACVYTNDCGLSMLIDDKKNMSRYSESPFTFLYPEKIKIVSDGDEIEIGGSLVAKAIFTPGHNPSCITWLIENCLFTGDAYIPGIKTVTNLPGGSKLDAEESILRIIGLGENYNIYPGHKI